MNCLRFVRTEITHGFSVQSVFFIFLAFCVVFLLLFCASLFCVLCPMLLVSLDFPLLIVLSSGFSIIYLI